MSRWLKWKESIQLKYGWEQLEFVRFFQLLPISVIYSLRYRLKCGGQGRMAKEQLPAIRQVDCDHLSCEHYTERRFDILNGFELVETRCANCHKILITKIIKIG